MLCAVCVVGFVDNGSHNVSRWMTWLPISLKNAVKCDKWYQLQNHSITESLNANGAWEKPFWVIPVHAIFSVSNKKQHTPQRVLTHYIYTHSRVCVCLRVRPGCVYVRVYMHNVYAHCILVGDGQNRVYSAVQSSLVIAKQEVEHIYICIFIYVCICAHNLL